MHQAIVALIGRPNVGKSTFFNRLVGRTEAIVDSVSGITRDRHYGFFEWNSRIIMIIDTGGYVLCNDDYFDQSIRKQIEIAIKSADVIFFMVDAITGPIKEDYQVVDLLRKYQKPIMLIVNKVDNTKILLNSVDFYKLGFNKYYCLSSNNGSGSGEILDELVISLPPISISKKKSIKNIPTIAIVGRPNVGKSTLLNTFLKEERHIVTEKPSTTRDALQVYYSSFGFECIFVDTAGIRKISKINDNIEYYAVMRTIRTIKSVDVCLLIIDAEIGWQCQDMNIYNIIEKNNKSVVILVNKWDKIKKKSIKEYEKKIIAKISYFNDVPIIFISALFKKRILHVLEISLKVFKNRKKKIKTSHLNDIMLPILKNNPPSAVKGRYITIKYCTQLPSSTPQFAFFSNMPQYIKSSYKKFIENQLRKNFDFIGVPIRIYFK